ncbi:hypothetical protein GWI33_005413 [Rhynchophorus ferrugineus]|uniref:Uncharacterized protein n=1 Tax=Rhynchophorus ferrugineus TaxID=354439 RepID=A0A834ILM9_RHYFE|nr:hypothetical protein GWI33_005413 [Rhynchophorus ferrugineus]
MCLKINGYFFLRISCPYLSSLQQGQTTQVKKGSKCSPHFPYKLREPDSVYATVRTSTIPSLHLRRSVPDRLRCDLSAQTGRSDRDWAVFSGIRVVFQRLGENAPFKRPASERR